MKSNMKRITLPAMFTALGVVLPMGVHFIPNGGSIVLPMHIPILLCGLICGWKYGIVVGLLTPLLSSLLTGMPPFGYLPVMMIELTVYGMVSGIVINKVTFKSRSLSLYLALIIAMLSGRLVMGIINAFIFKAGNYSLSMWVSTAFLTSLPGIIIQLVLIPSLILILEKAFIKEPTYESKDDSIL